MNKEEIIRLLEDKRYDELLRIAADNRRIIKLLISLTYDKKSIVCWRAIESIGLITKEIAKTQPEHVRNLIGRLLWMIRDESGGIGWSSPEMLGEIVRNSPELFADVAPIIVFFLEEEKLSRGVLWAIGRIGEVKKELVIHSAPQILQYLHNPDPMLRGLAAFALGKIGTLEYLKTIERLKNDNELIQFYEDEELNDKRVCAIAEDAIARINTK
ncbi:MAG: HEAT repeat domain-containing protein [Nitrospirae bacterium]|nr:HEAT repeat domain-containing protein [Nitrospirota bacterium]